MLKGLNRKVGFTSPKSTSTVALVGEDGTYSVTVPGVPPDYTLTELAKFAKGKKASVTVAVTATGTDAPKRQYSSKDEKGDTFCPFIVAVAQSLGESPAGYETEDEESEEREESEVS